MLSADGEGLSAPENFRTIWINQTNGDINCLVRKHFQDVGMDLIKDL